MIKILIIKIGAIGDVVMTLPILSSLRKQYPNANITWICGKIPAPLIESTQEVDQILQINETSLLRGTFITRLWVLFKLWKVLFGRSYDLVLTAHADPRYRYLSFFCRKKEHRYFNRLGERLFPIPGRYHLDEYARLASNLEGPIFKSPSLPKLTLPENPWLNKFMATLPKNPTIVISPGGAKNTLSDDALRRWPVRSYAKLAKELSSYNLNVIVSGSNDDKWVESYFQNVQYYNLIGKLSILDFISLLKKADLFITHDSGPLHLSKFAPCPKIALFGPTNPTEKVSPLENIHVLWKGSKFPCSPCYDGKKYALCSKNTCLQSIAPQEVATKALNLIGVHKPLNAAYFSKTNC